MKRGFEQQFLGKIIEKGYRWNYAYWDEDTEINIIPDKIDNSRIVSWLQQREIENIGDYSDENSGLADGGKVNAK